MKKRTRKRFGTAGLMLVALLFLGGLLAVAALSPEASTAAAFAAFGMAISFDKIPQSIRKPGKYLEINTKLAVRNLPANDYRMLIVGQRLGARIDPARFQGGTLNDATSGGTFTGNAKKDFIVKISTAAATDKFQYSTDGGANWSTETDLTGAAQALEDGVTITFGATTGHAVGDEWRFSAWAEPSVAELTPTQVFSDVEAAEMFGYGSIVHLMAHAALYANRYLDLSVCALDDAAGTAAAGSVTISGPATASGSFKLYIGSEKIEVGYSKDDTATAIALALQAEMEKYPGLPVTFSVDAAAAGKINLTARNKGLCGNEIHIGYSVTVNSGVSATVVAMTGGATDPDVSNALTAVVAEQYDIIATPYNNETALVSLRDHLDTVSGPMEQRPGIGAFGMAGDLASATTLSGLINGGRIQNKYLRYTGATSRQSISYELAASYAAVKAFETDPARPLNTLELKGIAPPAIDDRLNRTEQETCLKNGVSPLEVGPGEKVQIVRSITTYTKDGQGIDDVSLLDVTTICTLDYVRKAIRDRISLRFPREKLSSKTPDKVRAEIIDVLVKLEELEIVEEVTANLDGLVVERSSTDANRVDAKIPTDVVNGLHVFAGRIDLLL